MPSYQTLDVPVQGGTLRVGLWGTRGPVVVAAHGITGNHLAFAALADQLGDEWRLLAPDLRGRGGSRDITGPWGMAAHAADLVAALDHLRIEQAPILLGHSMGAFVAVVAAAQYAGRFGALLLVDGGFQAIDKPANLSVEELAQAVLGPSMRRLDMTFATRAAYLDFWRPHPALAADWSDYVERQFDYDLIGTSPQLVSGVRKEAVVLDVESELLSDLVPRSLDALRLPVRFLRAPHGLMNGPPLYADAALQAAGARLPRFSRADIADVNHYTILLSERGARAVAAEMRTLL